MTENKSRFIVTTEWVEKQLGAPEFRIVDASWYLPAQNRNGAEEYASGHIPGAVFFDQDVIADHNSGLPHTVPTAYMFKREVEKLGIADTDTIVVYDGPGIFTAPRVWWLFRLFGAEKVYVMDGGIDGWKREGRPLQTDLPEPAPAVFNINYHSERITSFTSMQEIVASRSAQIADARGAGRFTGEEPEPRAGMRSGHMPGARSTPVGSFSENGKFKDLQSLKRIFDESGIDLKKPVVTSCGSGVTAAVISLALESLDHANHSLYDGSWSEWGARDDTPVATGRD